MGATIKRAAGAAVHAMLSAYLGTECAAYLAALWSYQPLLPAIFSTGSAPKSKSPSRRAFALTLGWS